MADPDVDTKFSGAGVSADEVLTDLIARDSAPRRLLVVTSDRAIGQAARRRGARTIGSAEFWRRVARDLARSGAVTENAEPAEKFEGGPAGSAEAWLREWGLERDARGERAGE